MSNNVIFCVSCISIWIQNTVYGILIYLGKNTILLWPLSFQIEQCTFQYCNSKWRHCVNCDPGNLPKYIQSIISVISRFVWVYILQYFWGFLWCICNKIKERTYQYWRLSGALRPRPLFPTSKMIWRSRQFNDIVTYWQYYYDTFI